MRQAAELAAVAALHGLAFRQRAIAARRAHSWRCALVELSTRACAPRRPIFCKSKQHAWRRHGHTAFGVAWLDGAASRVPPYPPRACRAKLKHRKKVLDWWHQ